MKKKIIFGLLTIFICFALVGCGTEDLNDDEESIGENESQENTPAEKFSLYSDDKKIVFNYSDIYYVVYYYEGEQITGLEYVYDCENEAAAKITKTMLDESYKDEPNLKDIKINGSTIVITFTEGAYKDETLSDVKTTYSFLEQVYANAND